MSCSVETRYGRFRVRHPSLLPHVMRLVRSLDSVVERRDCGTGAGGFKPGNKCAGGGGEGGAGGAGDGGSGASGGDSEGATGSVRDERLDRWREREAKALGDVRDRISSAQEIADQLVSDSRAKVDKLVRDREVERDARDVLKEKSRASLKKLEETAMEFADAELKARLEKMDPIRRELFLTKNKQSDPRVEAARQERLQAQSLVQESAAKLAGLTKQIDQEEEFAARQARDSRVEAWREIGKYSANAATSSFDDDGDSYSQDLFERTKERFSAEMQSMSISGQASPEDIKRFEDGPKREAVEFLSAVVNPATLSANSMASAEIKVDNIDRAYASRDSIHVSPYSSPSTVIHELGHVFESSDLSIRDAATAFHRHRCDESQNVRMADISSQSGYSDSEIGNMDDFGKTVAAVYGAEKYEDPDVLQSRVKARTAYLGKAYKDDKGKTIATELISIGLEMMHSNPAAFAKADPEYFDFMLGVVSGKIRRARKRKT